jgi:hypothetical protein
VRELRPTLASVISCHAAPEALDALEAAQDAYLCRVAPDEVMLIGEGGAAGDLARITARLFASDRDAIVLDATDGWAIWTLQGDDLGDAFAHLSAVPLPDKGFVQGDVAHVPVKVVSVPGTVHFLVPAMWREHLRERILRDCPGVAERVEPAAWADRGPS